MEEATVEDSAWPESLFEGIHQSKDSERVLSLEQMRDGAMTTQIECYREEWIDEAQRPPF